MSELSQAIEKVDGGGIDWLKEVADDTRVVQVYGAKEFRLYDIEPKNLKKEALYVLIGRTTQKERNHTTFTERYVILPVFVEYDNDAKKDIVKPYANGVMLTLGYYQLFTGHSTNTAIGVYANRHQYAEYKFETLDGSITLNPSCKVYEVVNK